MQFEQGKKMLITTDAFFFAPDGKQYRAVYGVCKGIHDADGTLGLKTNRNSTNWYVEIGNMLVAGCQIHYAVATDECNVGLASGYDVVEGEVRYFKVPSQIYDAGD